MSYSNNDALTLEKNVQESKSLLNWYENFKHGNLSDLKEYFEVCDASDRHFVGELITSTNSLEIELKQLCDKSTWQFMPLKDWNIVNSSLHHKIRKIRDGYAIISPKILAHQEASNLILE